MNRLYNKMTTKTKKTTIKVAKELEGLLENRYMKRTTEMTEGCCTNPAVITVKQDKLINI